MRRRLMLATLGVVGLGLAILTTGFYLALSHRLEADADAVMRSQADALASRVSLDGGALSVEPRATRPATSQSSAVWVYDRSGRPVLRSPGSADLEGDTTALAAVSASTFHDVGNGVRLFAEPVSIGGNNVATVVVTQLRAPYEHTEAIALRGALILDLLVLGGVGLLASWLITAALRPVEHMTRQAEDWSAHDLDRRFALGTPHDELTHLAATLDGLLDRLAASLRHEQHLTDEVAHELRTPLARLRTEAEVALRHRRTDAELRTALQSVVADADSLDGAVESLLLASRRDPALRNGTCPVGVAVTASLTAARSTADARGVHIDTDIDETLVVGTDGATLSRILAPLLDNAIAYADGHVHVIGERDGAMHRIVVTDDGPGFDPGELDSVFAPGERGAAGGALKPDGHGLGLALARRLARSAGGDVDAHAGPGGRVVVSLPRA